MSKIVVPFFKLGIEVCIFKFSCYCSFISVHAGRMQNSMAVVNRVFVF